MPILKDLLPILITPLLGAVGILLQELRHKRDSRFQRQQARSEATELIDLIQKWLQAQQLACSAEELERVCKLTTRAESRQS